MNVVRVGEGHTGARGGHCLGSVLHTDRRTKLTFLRIEELVADLAAILARAGVRAIRTIVPKRTVRLVVDPGAMSMAFAMLARRMARGAVVTVLGGLLPIRAGEESDGNGCVLLSISVRSGKSAESGFSEDALTDLSGMIKKHGGSFRLDGRRGETEFNLYLPVLHDARREDSTIQ